MVHHLDLKQCNIVENHLNFAKKKTTFNSVPMPFLHNSFSLLIHISGKQLSTDNILCIEEKKKKVIRKGFVFSVAYLRMIIIIR